MKEQIEKQMNEQPRGDLENFKTFLKDNFFAFKDSFMQSIRAKSSSAISKQIENMDLHVAILFTDGDIHSNVLSGHLVVGEKCIDLLKYEEKSWVERVEREYEKCCSGGITSIKSTNEDIKEIDGTGLDITDKMPGPYYVKWFVSIGKEQGNAGKHIEIVASLIVSTLVEYVDNLNKITRNNQAGIDEWFEKKKFDFMEYYIRELYKIFPSIPDVRTLTKISGLKYERRSNEGSIYFVNEENLQFIIKDMIKFTKGSCLQENSAENIRKIRKLLEMCRESGRCLVARNGGSGSEIVGLLSDSQKMDNIECIKIHFDDTKWQIYYGNEMVLKYQDAEYYINSDNEENVLEEKCKKAGLNYNIFGKIFQELEEKVSHGALVIIASDAKSQAETLCGTYNRGMQIEPIDITPENYQLLLGMASIDGAVLLDFSGRCYGFSVILDGLALVEGNSGKGSRYNSAINYIANRPDAEERIAFIRSEDKEKPSEIVRYEDLKILNRDYT